MVCMLFLYILNKYVIYTDILFYIHITFMENKNVMFAS